MKIFACLLVVTSALDVTVSFGTPTIKDSAIKGQECHYADPFKQPCKVIFHIQPNEIGFFVSLHASEPG
jgi:hypothetical protein